MKKIIAVVNHSPLLSDLQVRAMAAAANVCFAYDFAPLYSDGMVLGVVPPIVQVYADESAIPVGAAISKFMNEDSDVPGALAYHTKDGDEIESPIFPRTIMSDGGGVGVGGALDAWSVAVAAMHEWLELAADPDCNTYARRRDGKLVAWENVDPVEGSAYLRTVLVHMPNRTVVRETVSCPNFVGPKWFDLEAPAGSRFDHLGVLSAPFEKLSTGYVDVIDASKIGDTQEMRLTREAGTEYRQRAYKALATSRGAWRGARPIVAS